MDSHNLSPFGSDLRLIYWKLLAREWGGHFHIASDMDVRQIRVSFFTLKSAKCVFLSLKTLQRVSFLGCQDLKLLYNHNFL